MMMDKSLLDKWCISITEGPPFDWGIHIGLPGTYPEFELYSLTKGEAYRFTQNLIDMLEEECEDLSSFRRSTLEERECIIGNCYAWFRSARRPELYNLGRDFLRKEGEGDKLDLREKIRLGKILKDLGYE